MKHAVLEKKRRAAGTGGGGPLPDLPFEDLVSVIIGDTTNLVNGVEGKYNSKYFPTSRSSPHQPRPLLYSVYVFLITSTPYRPNE